ncbi:MAG: hypothetical protein FKY71_08345 [Spiribacter salinus]|uniref:DUF2634 domain-containing protein n=1 Tax=Spiribacter salinus TaxID=1335746 RepID=A0A540VS70_9GAMM|nr:MAG: hypothetical protein FKY71_08345 [Spiribacter salinus]
MLDYKLVDGDIVVSGGAIDTVVDQAATRQRLVQKLRLWQGEWFLNTAAGFPWLQQILGQTPRPEVVSSLLRQLIEDDSGVRNVTELDLQYGGTSRELTATFTALLTNGQEEEFEVTL